MQKHKKCSIEGCNNPLYARGYCISHYRSLYLFPKSKLKEKKIYHIPKSTKKKKDLNMAYSTSRVLFIKSEREKDKYGKLFCIFCGKEIKEEPSLHHMLGREDDIILDDNYWFLSHNFCHVHQYHSISYTKISWWDDYILRLANLDRFDLLEIELRKMNK